MEPLEVAVGSPAGKPKRLIFDEAGPRSTLSRSQSTPPVKNVDSNVEIVKSSLHLPVKEQRAVKRRQLYQIVAKVARRKGRSLLEERSVQRPAQAYFETVLEKLKKSHLGFQLNELSNERMDEILVKEIKDFFFEGESCAKASVSLAAVGWKVARWARQGRRLLPRACQALRGFTRLAPIHSRIPIPMSLVFGPALAVEKLGKLSLAAGTLLGFHLYLRPGEWLEALWRHGSPSVVKHLGGQQGGTLTLRPQEERVPTKVYKVVDSVSIGQEDRQFLNRAGWINEQVGKWEEKVLQFCLSAVEVLPKVLLNSSRPLKWP